MRSANVLGGFKDQLMSWQNQLKVIGSFLLYSLANFRNMVQTKGIFLFIGAQQNTYRALSGSLTCWIRSARNLKLSKLQMKYKESSTMLSSRNMSYNQVTFHLTNFMFTWRVDDYHKMRQRCVWQIISVKFNLLRSGMKTSLKNCFWLLIEQLF